MYMCSKLNRSLNKRKSNFASDDAFASLTNRVESNEKVGDEADIDLFVNEGDEDGDRAAAVGDEVRGGFDDQDSVASDELSDQDEAELSEDDDNNDKTIHDNSTREEQPAVVEVTVGDVQSDFATIRRQLLQEALGGTNTEESPELRADSAIEAPPPEPLKALVLPLFATLSPERQRKVFEALEFCPFWVFAHCWDY